VRCAVVAGTCSRDTAMAPHPKEGTYDLLSVRILSSIRFRCNVGWTCFLVALSLYIYLQTCPCVATYLQTMNFIFNQNWMSDIIWW